jgi:hypothetical protein
MRTSAICMICVICIITGCTENVPGYCDSDTPCATGQTCNLARRTCETAADAGGGGNGARCSTDDRCASGFCVDGVCCDSRCEGTCRSCASPASLGACAAVPAGQDPRHSCAGSAAACSGLCDGTGGCSYPDATKACAPSSCVAGAVTRSRCDGNGGCGGVTTSCAPHLCDTAGIDCTTSCNGPATCAASGYCDGAQCQPKKDNGTSCGAALECTSGVCTTEQVCCDTACAGDCETCAGKSSCSSKPVGAPCGTKLPFCDDGPTTSVIKAQQCDAQKSCTTVVVTACDPYRCAGATPACTTGCSANAGCTTGVCDLFDKKNTCPASGICFVDAKSCPAGGTGTQASPACKIQGCLQGAYPYVAIADGTYAENLTAKGNVQLISTGTVGPLHNGTTFQAKVFISPKLPSTVGLEIGQHKVYAYGLDISHVAPSIPPASSDPSGVLVHAGALADVTLKSCRIHHAHQGYGIHAQGSTALTLDDVVVDFCGANGLYAEATDLVTLQTVGLHWNQGLGMLQDSKSLKMRDVAIGANLAGLKTYHVDLDVDRVRIANNFGLGMELQSTTTGKVTNALLNGNWGSAIKLVSNGAPPMFSSITVANNGAPEIDCDYTTYVYNSVVWDNDTSMATPSCAFFYCDIKGTVTGSSNLSQDPLFIGSGAEPYALQASSPCVDYGNTVGAPAPPALDILKNPRQVKKSGPRMLDLGAFEVQ